MMKFDLPKATLVGGIATALVLGAGASSAQAAEGRNAAAIAGAVGGLAVGSALAAGAGGAYAAPPARVVRERRVIVEDDADEEVCEVRVRRTYVDGVGYQTRRVRVCE